MRLLEIEPDADAARRIDLEIAVVVDVAELLGRRVVEHEHYGRQSLRQIEILVEHIRHVHRAIAAIVQQLEIFSKLPSLPCVEAIMVGDEVILQHHYSSHLIGDAIGIGFCTRNMVAARSGSDCVSVGWSSGGSAYTTGG